MKRQPFCALPWCGKTGKIDMHHIKRRSQGGGDEDDNLVPLCHDCHMAHHDGRKTLAFHYHGKELWASYANGINLDRCIVFNEYDQSVPFDEPTEDEGDKLYALTQQLGELANSANTLDYYIGCTLIALDKLLTTEELRMQVEETFGLSPKSVPSYISRRKKIARLDEQYASLGLTRLLLLAEAVEKSDLPIEALVVDLRVLSAQDFAATHLGKKTAAEKDRHACPDCGRVHVCKEE